MKFNRGVRLTGLALLFVFGSLSFGGQRTGAAVIENFDNPNPGAVKWKIYDYNRITTHPSSIPYKVPGGIAFDFLNTPDTALLGTIHPSYKGDLLGNMTGKTVSATVGVSVTPGTVFTYYGEPDGCG